MPLFQKMDRVGFAEGPIAHGLLTFGVVTRAVLRYLGGGTLMEIGASFRKPVWPGDTIRTVGFAVKPGTFAIEAFAADRPDPVITSAWATTTP
jgi:hypothetical protein